MKLNEVKWKTIIFLKYMVFGNSFNYCSEMRISAQNCMATLIVLVVVVNYNFS